ncbi:alpha/beta fold hydrolase [Mucilaginibacter sp. BJC16-A38]|uniref:alpha/beta hydrolase family protein n=1 Tax=Mucilaginibacter phenanthrenivorans TaxID=1234842 RepID=UPI0021581CFB|nr:alpha/beta fold hydrolase [Mucilaginibacter phenanthrenivorans]MCR8561886.1 alpha/beta fold hydrolase [Mucilaginibacter phenanthrenivorans]
MIKKQNFNIPGAKGRGMLMDLTYRTSLKNAPLVIFAHGFKGFKDWGAHNLVANYFAEHGFRFLKFNFSHNGTTADHPTDFADLIAFADNTFSIELEDLKAVIDFACGGSGIAAASGVYLMGHSMGGGISIIKAVEDGRVKKLITMSSISGFRNLWPKDIEEQWRLTGITYMPNKRTGQMMPLKVALLDDLDKNPARLDILAHAANVKQPWLIVHGDEDTSVPLAHAEELKAAQPHATFSVIKGGDHVLGATHPFVEPALPAALLRFCEQSVTFLKK